ncbi:MAG: xanthine dehydrogenase family protein molybdopterin-binding subunit, partial [Rhodospirillales bacterium]
MHGPIGERVIRKEDSRLLTGNGQFSDDHSIEKQTWAVMVRSPHAHAIIKSINATAALSIDGVLGVLSGEDCVKDRLEHIPHSPFPSTNFDMKLHAPGKELGEDEFTGSHMPLPSDKVRYVGEAVAMVVAETRALANEAAELVEVDYEVLDCVTHALDAERDDAPRIWEDIPSNVFIDTYFGDQLATERAFAGADHVVKMSFDIPRVTGVPMEPRSALGVYDQEKDKYTLFAGSGGTVRQKREIAEVLGVPLEKVRVYALDVGGNFGTRNRTYVEFPLVVWASKKIGRPVKCTVERSESMVSDYQGRDLQVDMELAINKEGKFLALRASNLSNVGARCVSLSPLSKGSGIITGSYRIPAAYLRSRAVFTNTAPTNAYRSSGRPEIIYCIERMVEVAAKECGFDSLELRRKNLISEAEMPYQNAVGMIYDSGKYEKSLDMAIGLADFSDFEIRQIKARERGKLLGRGIAHYVESSIGSPIEETQLHVLPDDDRIDLVIGTQPSGQGHET